MKQNTKMNTKGAMGGPLAALVYGAIRKMNTKGAMGGPLAALVYGAIAVLVVVMVVAFGQQFLVTTQASFATNSAAYNSTTQGITGLGTFSSNIGTIALALVLLVIIGLLIGVASGRL